MFAAVDDLSDPFWRAVEIREQIGSSPLHSDANPELNFCGAAGMARHAAGHIPVESDFERIRGKPASLKSASGLGTDASWPANPMRWI